jgi:nucleoside-triphosphatase THEP1
MGNGGGSPTGKKNILLTGRPRVGKSTLVRRVIERLRERGFTKMGGFYTLEVSQGGNRIGFDIHTLDGRIGRLARVDLESRFRLGKYGIDMEQFESVAVPALEEAIRLGCLVVIDEIGFMELKSRRFRERVEEALSSPASVLAAIMRNRFDFPDAIKAREDVLLITVTVENRDRLVEEIVERIRERIG